MAQSPKLPPDETEALAEVLHGLGSGVRLDILRQLRFPKALRDIRVTPRRHRPDESPDRTMAPQSVLSHLKILMELGLVKQLEDPDGPVKNRYVVNRQKLFSLGRDVGLLSAAPGGASPTSDATTAIDTHFVEERLDGPHLVLVQGAYEGRRYALTQSTAAPDGRWVLGRLNDAAVVLDYDPFVSRENSVIELRRGRFVIADLPGSNNGTRLDGRLLARDEAADLAPGAVIGLGRSLLVFVDGK